MTNSARLARAALYSGTALVIAKLLFTGQLHYFLSPSFDGLTALTGVALAAVAVVELVQLRRHPHHGRTNLEALLTPGLVAVPLVMALMVSPRALGVGSLGSTPLRLVLQFDGPAGVSAGPPPAPREPLGDVGDVVRYLRLVGDRSIGQHVHARGLAARGDGLASNEFVLVRYAIVHCVADAQPVGLLVVAPQPIEVANDQWIDIDGTLASQVRDGVRLVSIQADQLARTDEPREPYIFGY